MASITIYYTISNNGDGSAGVHFFADHICAEVHESLESEPFAEGTVNCIYVSTDADCPNVNLLCGDVKTKEQYLAELQEDLDFELKYNPDCLQEPAPYTRNPNVSDFENDMNEYRYNERQLTRGRRLKNAIEKLKNG